MMYEFRVRLGRGARARAVLRLHVARRHLVRDELGLLQASRQREDDRQLAMR